MLQKIGNTFPFLETAFAKIQEIYLEIKTTLSDLFFVFCVAVCMLVVVPLLTVMTAFSIPGLALRGLHFARIKQDRMVFYDNTPLDSEEYRNLSFTTAIRKAQSDFVGNDLAYLEMVREANEYMISLDLDELFAHEFFTVGNKEIHVVRSKEFDPMKKTIIAFHGNVGSNFNFAGPMSLLAKDYNIILPEIKGYGVMSKSGSEAPKSGDIQRYLGALAHELFDKSRYNLDPSNTIVLGYSLGSKIASSFVRQAEFNCKVRFYNVVFLTTFISVIKLSLEKFGLLGSRAHNLLVNFLLGIVEFIASFFISHVSDWSDSEAMNIKSPISVLHGLRDTTIPAHNAYALSTHLAKKRLHSSKDGSKANGVKIMLSAKDDHISILKMFLMDYHNVLCQPSKKESFEVGFYTDNVKGERLYYPAVVRDNIFYVDGMSEESVANIERSLQDFDGSGIVNHNHEECSFISSSAISNHVSNSLRI
ncbi:hypothetical protein CAXC1_120036 [Candidatus Xenohaliotis californiensis]|uniref:Alpha/beta hydrolase family protein n=1 Tax=Candidatus Xenohaliotis californiensis TaxID=84677 RepID=A0ABM9N700_9RICK|nr:hypothetical protein CAXC1_120036 [Candidatus Xenohaliotis californiensis]